MERKRPTSRKTFTTGQSAGVHKRGEGQNTGPVGGGQQPGQPSGGGGHRGTGGGGTRGGGKSPLMILILLAVALFGGGGGLIGSGGLDGLLGDGGSTGASQSVVQNLSGGSSSSGWTSNANVQQLDNTVADGSRAKRTQILGNGQDEVTIMVYMCGTDLESRSGMATRDLMEMTKATLSDKVHLIVYTGGCTQWQNQVISTRVNQIYEVKSGGLQCLVQDAGSSAMTDAKTLSSFIQWCAKNYPANRNELIFWDHGGGSVTGYGYDQKFPRAGSMSLAEIDQALKDGGITFDFVGFDTCLMATVENALMLDKHADYLIASEETEPGVGWYYTDWLTSLSRNPSMPTVEIGKLIVDTFVDTCAATCRGQLCTLSVVDLAELANTAPDSLSSFSKSLSGLITNNEYKQVSMARNSTREFAQSSVIDQVDLVHFARNLNNQEGAALAEDLLGAVKYNRTSTNMSNAYGLSIYFPYRKLSQVDQAVDTYKQIGLDDSYSQCIREFAGLEASGQVSSGGTASPLPYLLGQLTGSSAGNSDMIGALLSTFLSGDFGTIQGLSGSNTGFFSGRSMSTEDTVAYLTDNSFDSSNLTWTENDAGELVIAMPEDQWDLITGLDLNLFVDDGEGYVDMGLDNVFDFDDDGNLLAATDHTWLSVNNQPVAYYHENTQGEGDEAIITGRIPALLNDQRVDLLVEFTPENPRGSITGARPVYDPEETETVAKSLTELEDGDTLEFLCDYYTYDGEYESSYFLGEPMTVNGELMLSNEDVMSDSVRVTYRFTDIYQQHYWTEPLGQDIS